MDQQGSSEQLQNQLQSAEFVSVEPIVKNTNKTQSLPIPLPAETQHKEVQSAKVYRYIKMKVDIYPETSFSDNLKKNIESLKFPYETQVKILISNIQKQLNDNVYIRDFNIIIKINHENALIPDIDTQQNGLTKLNIKSYFHQEYNRTQHNQNNQKPFQLDNDIINFLNSQLLDIFPNRKISEEDSIIITINLELQDQQQPE